MNLFFCQCCSRGFSTGSKYWSPNHIGTCQHSSYNLPWTNKSFGWFEVFICCGKGCPKSPSRKLAKTDRSTDCRPLADQKLSDRAKISNLFIQKSPEILFAIFNRKKHNKIKGWLSWTLIVLHYPKLFFVKKLIFQFF